MEIGVRVEAENLLTGEVRHAASAYLTYVSLDERESRPKFPHSVWRLRRGSDATAKERRPAMRLASK